MKKITLFAFALVMLALASCDKDPFHHSLNIVYPGDICYVYADQTEDSISFVTWDSYEVFPYSASGTWLSVLDSEQRPARMTLRNGYYFGYYGSVDLRFQANLDKECRVGYVAVRSYGDDKWDETGYGVYFQFHWHNIMKPTPVLQYDRGADGSRILKTASFELKDTALQVVDTIRFEAYADWTLESDNEALVSPQTTTGAKGKQRVLLNVTPNETEEPHTAQLTLKSANGATTTIRFMQEGLKKKE